MTIEQLNNDILSLVQRSTESEIRITPDTHLIREMGLSSVEIMLLVSDLEDHFDVTIAPSKLRRAQTVGDLAQLVIDDIRNG